MENKLTVLWITRDKEAALNMGFMYARNAKLNHWWEEVEVIIWGPSADIAVNDADIGGEIKMLLEIGVRVSACGACSDRYGVSDKLRDMGVQVQGMGVPLTEDLKGGARVITV